MKLIVSNDETIYSGDPNVTPYDEAIEFCQPGLWRIEVETGEYGEMWGGRVKLVTLVADGFNHMDIPEWREAGVVGVDSGCAAFHGDTGFNNDNNMNEAGVLLPSREILPETTRRFWFHPGFGDGGYQLYTKQDPKTYKVIAVRMSCIDERCVIQELGESGETVDIFGPIEFQDEAAKIIENRNLRTDTYRILAMKMVDELPEKEEDSDGDAD